MPGCGVEGSPEEEGWMLLLCYPGTGLPGGGHWPVAQSPWRTEPGAGDGFGCEMEAHVGQDQGLRRGTGVTGEGRACTCPGVEKEEDG